MKVDLARFILVTVSAALLIACAVAGALAATQSATPRGGHGAGGGSIIMPVGPLIGRLSSG